jgi:hypothetical protein
MSTDSQNSGVSGVVEETLTNAAAILRSFWRRFSSNTPPSIPSGIESDVRDTDLTKFLEQLMAQAKDAKLTLRGTLDDRQTEIQVKLGAKDYDGAEPLVISLSNDLKKAIGEKDQWMKVAAEFSSSKIAIDELYSKWSCPEVMGTKGFKAVADGIEKSASEQDYSGAMVEYESMLESSLDPVELLRQYPDRKEWDDLDDTLSQAIDECKHLGTLQAPEHEELLKELNRLRDLATPEKKDYKAAVAGLPNLASRITSLHGLYPSRGEWADLAKKDLPRVRRWINDLNGWHTAEGETLSQRLLTINQQATDKDKKYAEAVVAFKTLEKDVDIAHHYWSKLKAVEIDYLRVLEEKPDNAGALRAAMAAATGLGEDKKYQEAMNVLERLKGLLKVAFLSNNDLYYLASHVSKLRIGAEAGLSSIESKLRQANQVDANRVADALKELVSKLPTSLEAKLRELDEAEESAVVGLKSAVKAAAQEWLNFLATHKKALDACAANPFKVPFALPTPLTSTIKTILQQVA